MSYDSFAEAIPTMTYEEQINLLEVLVNAVKCGLNKSAQKKEQKSSYPEGYFSLFGSCNDDSFVAPEELSWELDSKREFLDC